MTVTVRPDAGGTYGALQVGGVDVLKFGAGAAGDPLEVAKVPDIASKLNASGSAPMYACRAWVNFNGTGTVAIRASGNVSSITDNGVGDYTVNFTTAMSDANYGVAVTRTYTTTYTSPATSGNDVQIGAKAAGSQRVHCVSASSTSSVAASPVDPLEVNITIFR